MSAPPTLPTGDVLEATAGIVSHYLGETMARSAIKAHCDKLRIDGAHMSPEQVAALVHKIGMGLNIFVGRDKAKAAVAEIQSAVARMGQMR
jgi:hypothetical protein